MAHACTFLLGRAASEEKPLSTTSTSGLEGRPAKIASAKTKTLQTSNLEHALGRPRARPPSCEPPSENQKPVARNHVQRTRRVLLQGTDARSAKFPHTPTPEPVLAFRAITSFQSQAWKQPQGSSQQNAPPRSPSSIPPPAQAAHSSTLRAVPSRV